MKDFINISLLAAREATDKALDAHRLLAAECQKLQENIAAQMRQNMGHGRHWTVNSREWSLAGVEVWVSSNIEFSEPTLRIKATIRPDDDEPLTAIRVEGKARLRDIDPGRILPTDITLPTTMPMNRTVDIYPHYRAGSWKVYRETNTKEL